MNPETTSLHKAPQAENLKGWFYVRSFQSSDTGDSCIRGFIEMHPNNLSVIQLRPQSDYKTFVHTKCGIQKE